MTTIVVFASSLFITSVLVLVKAMELRTGKKNFILELVCKLDSTCHKLVSGLKFKSLQLVQTVRYILFVQSKIFFKNLLTQVIEKIEDEFKLRQNVLMGHKNIIDRGSASFYLKKITEHKENGMRGKIVEEMQ